MSDFDLESKFPDLRPIRSAPSLFSVNGCGLNVYGSRDFDEETGTYVKTRCICLLFIPLVALDAFRVAAAPAGWYFLGKVPLSAPAKLWNGLLLVFLLALGGHLAWDRYSNTPEYRAGRQLAEAGRAAEAGQVARAAQLYRDVVRGRTEHSTPAMVKIKDLLEGPVDQAPLDQAAEVFQVAVELQDHPGAAADLLDRGMALVKKRGEADPTGALAVLDTIAPLAKDTAALNVMRQQLLEPLVAKDPKNPDLASRLALVYEAQRQFPKCETLLTPLSDQLGPSEGARILGQLFARQGKLEKALALLQPYTDGRLKKLHVVEQAFRDALSNAQTQIINRLKEGLRDGTEANFPLTRYRNAGEVEQEKILREYVESRLKDDPTIKTAQEAMARAAGVVPVALDLGIALLHRAQGLTDPAKRRAELEKAEKIFLDIRGQAGKTDEYRLSLGQVYYWLGKHAEGRNLFDELLAAHNRKTDILLSVSHLLREVGDASAARALAEEAYEKETNQLKKYDAANLRSIMFKDLDDEITWLGRANPADPHVKASLSMNLGRKAAREGKDEEAAQHFREAARINAELPVSESTLNNGALAYSSLYHVTGERADLDKGLAMLEKATALRPSDSILLRNLARATLERAAYDLVGGSIDLKALKMEGRLDLLSYLYQDRPGRDRHLQRVRQHAGLAKALAHYDRLLILAPKNASTYSSLSAVHSSTRDLTALRGLWQRLESVEVDLTDTIREVMDFYQGKKDEKYREDWKPVLAQAEKEVNETRHTPGGTTFAVAVSHLAQLQMSGDELGLPVNPNALVALAEEVYTAAPSRATRSTLRSALLTRASKTLAQQEPAYAALASRGKRQLGPSYLIAVALSREDKLRETVRANADVQRVFALLRERVQQFPDEPDTWTWAMLRGAYAKEAAEVARAILQDELGQLERAIHLRLEPMSATAALQEYWAKQIAGKEAEGIELLKRRAAQGMPLPFDLK
jgi:tetratricopeptide (TPR) repeat protein